MTPQEWTTLAREASWVKRHPAELAWLVHVAAGAGIVYGGIGTNTQNLVVDGLGLAASLLAQLAASRATLPVGKEGAVLVPTGTLNDVAPPAKDQQPAS